MTLLAPEVVIEVVRYVPPPWFIMSMTGLSFALLALSFLMKDLKGFATFISVSIISFVSSSPYVYGFSPYAVYGYLFTLIFTLSGFIVGGIIKARSEVLNYG